jgi:hypothetical protein
MLHVLPAHAQVEPRSQRPVEPALLATPAYMLLPAEELLPLASLSSGVSQGEITFTPTSSTLLPNLLQ